MTSGTPEAFSGETAAKQKILIAEDDGISRRLLSATLTRLGYEVVEASDGQVAWELFRDDPRLNMVVLDWMMPELDGLELCRRIRRLEERDYTYIVFLTARGQQDDINLGLDSGADDYVVKPFDPTELGSRLAVGLRVLRLETTLQAKIDELERASGHVRELQGLLPICMHCKSIRDDADSWHRIEAYIESQTGAALTHTLCIGCLEKHYPEQYRAKKLREGKS